MPNYKKRNLHRIHTSFERCFRFSPSLVEMIEGTDLPIKDVCKSNRVPYSSLRNFFKKYRLTISNYRLLVQEKNGENGPKLIPKSSKGYKPKLGRILERFRTPFAGSRSSKNSYLYADAE